MIPKGFVPDPAPAQTAPQLPPGFQPDAPAAPAWIAQYAADHATAEEGLPKWSDYLKEHPQDKGAGNAFMSGVAQGASLGFYDELAGLAETGLNPGGASFWDKYKIGRDRAREEHRQAAEQHPIASTIGQVAGGVVSAPVALPLEGTGFAVNAARGAFSGALSGAGASEADSLKGVVQDAAKGGLVGAAVGGVTGALAEKAVRGAEGRLDERLVQDITGGRATTAGKKIYQNEDLVKAAAKKFNLQPNAEDPAALMDAANAARQQVGQQLGQAYETIGGETLGARSKDIIAAVKGVAREYSAPSEAPIQRQVESYLQDLTDRWGGVGKAARDRVTLQDLNAEIGNLEKMGFAGPTLSEAAGKQLKRDLASALEDVLQKRLEEIKDLGAGLAKSSLAKREGFSGVVQSAEAAQALPGLNADYRGLKLIENMARERAGLPPANRAAGGLRNAVGNAVDASLLFTHPAAFLAKKAGEKVLPAAARGADVALARLYSAAQSGSVTAQMLQDAIEQGVPRGLVERFSSAVTGSGASSAEQ